MTGYQSKRAAAQSKLVVTDKELMQQALEALTAYDGTNGASQRKRVLAALRDRLAQPEQERNFCSRCGKRTADLTVIHTCTPPQE